MRSSDLARFLAPSLLAMATLTAACASESDSAEAGDEAALEVIPEPAPVALPVNPGELVSNDGITVLAPPAEEAVFAEVLLESGRARILHLRTDALGRVSQIGDTAQSDADVKPAPAPAPAPADPVESGGVIGQAAGEATAPGSLDPCKDGASASMPFKWGNTFNWYFQADSTPSGLTATSVEAKLKRSVTNITAARNSCGIADQVSATQSYKGHTTRGTQVNSNATCPSGDGQNTVGFGPLPSGILGLTCIRYLSNGLAVETDVRLNSRYAWYADKPASCSGRYSIETVMTHEIGHAFGLGHVAETTHGNLTMSTKVNGTCQSSEATLGLGDVRALAAKY